MNAFINFILENWYIIIAIIAVICVAAFAVWQFAGLPTTEQLIKLREWLLYAVTVAEKELGGGTGKLKLRYVYDWFLTKFPWLAKLISFETFSEMVDDALVDMKTLLGSNEAVSAYVSGKEADEEIEKLKK